MKSFYLLATLASLSACAGGSASPEVSAVTTMAIQGGVDDTTHSFAVAVVRNGSGSTIALCTGVLLAPNLVATARHCVASISATTIDCATTTFGDVYPTSSLVVATDSTLAEIRVVYSVDSIVVPPGAGACGNDLALLVLSQNIVLPQYVTPTLNPPMTDHRVYSTTVTEIGFGVDTPADTMGTSSGTRRIIEDVDLVCIPNDPTFVNCFNDPAEKQFLSQNEFETTGGACEGDSGSGAFEQRSFNAGQWVSFGVLSRGGLDPDAELCSGEVYTRFDAWAQLITDTATLAATRGGYTLPPWAGGPTNVTSDAAATQPDANACFTSGALCNGNTDCCSVNCLSHDNGKTFLCAVCDANDPCDQNYVCDQGTCVAGEADSSPSSVASGSAMVVRGGGSAASAGCALSWGSERRSRSGPFTAVSAFALGAVVLGRRRRRPVRSARSRRTKRAA
jgi:secreted trypsin-like serine protease